MKRRVAALDGTKPDILVVGGGIHGAWAALEASLRGLEVALVERDDFGSGASANSLKIIHGGFRYLASAQLGRLRKSARELSTLMGFAPELVVPMPCMLRTLRRPGRGKPSLWIALKAYEVLTTGIETESVDGGGLISTREVEQLCPALGGLEHTGGAVWNDGQLLDSERFVLAVLGAAVEKGGTVVNYAEASTFITRGDRVVEVEVRDGLKGGSVSVRPRMIYNATNLPPASIGCWEGEADGAEGEKSWPHVTGFNVIVDRQVSEIGVGLESIASGKVSVSEKGPRRMFFLAPWQERTLLGTGYVPGGERRPAAVEEASVAALLSAFNRAVPALDLSLDEVTHLHVGSLPAEEARGELRPVNDRTVREGERSPAPKNMVGAFGPKYTTARLSAVDGVDECERRLGRRVSSPVTEKLARGRLPHAHTGPGPGQEITAEFVRRAVSAEMTVRLGDLLLRRTNVGAAGPPPRDAVERAATLMGDELGWDRSERLSEIRSYWSEYHPLVRPDVPWSERMRGRQSDAESPNRRGRTS